MNGKWLRNFLFICLVGAFPIVFLFVFIFVEIFKGIANLLK